MGSNPSTGISSQVDEVVIRFPAQSGYLSLCRINASTIASMMGFDIDDLDDIRLAVNESVTWLLLGSGAGHGSVELRLQGVSGAFQFVAVRYEEDLEDEPVDDLVSAILGATVDHYSTRSTATERQLQFVKQLSHE